MLTDDLKNIVKGDVSDDKDTLDTFQIDTSLFEVRPSVVVAPKDLEDLKSLVQYASGHEGVSLTARSGGTGMDGGALSESIVLDFGKYFTKISEVTSLFATAEAGTYYRDFEKRTLEHGAIMPSYPASRELCMVGGIVANNSGGELTLKYGKTEDYIKQLKVVFADGNEYVVKPLEKGDLDMKMAQGDFEGNLYKQLFELIENNYDTIKKAKPNVHKNSAGYYLWNVWDRDTKIFDLTKLIVGSQGTLGLITEATLKLVQKPKESQMMVLFLDSIDDVGEIVNKVLSHGPTTFESYDDKTLKLATKFWWEFIKRLGVWNIVALGIHTIPEFFSVLFHGFPKLVLQITFDGDDKTELKGLAEELEGELKQFNPRFMEVVSSNIEADEYWLVRRESFNLLRHKVQGKKTAPFVDDVSVRPEVLPDFFPKLNAIFESYGEKMIYNVAGHIGDGNFHIIPLMDMTDESARALIPEVAQKVYDLVLEYKGSITGEHNDGIIRTPFLKQQYGEHIYGLFEQTKQIFDPKNIFNPGKKVGGTMEYAIAHIKRHN